MFLKSLILQVPPSIPFFFSYNLPLLTYRISHILDFADDIFVAWVNMFFHPLYFLQTGIWIQKFDQIQVESFDKGKEDGVVFRRHMAFFCVFMILTATVSRWLDPLISVRLQKGAILICYLFFIY